MKVSKRWVRASMQAAILALVCRTCAQMITTRTGTDFTFPSRTVPALNAPLGFLGGVAVGSQGNVYISRGGNNRVLRLTQDGLVSIVAGNGVADDTGDGGPATAANLAVDRTHLSFADAGTSSARGQNNTTPNQGGAPLPFTTAVTHGTGTGDQVPVTLATGGQASAVVNLSER